MTESPHKICVYSFLGCGGLMIANGGVDFPEGTDYNATAYMKCSDGYTLIGSNATTCLASGTWNKSSVCEIKGK